MSTSLPSSPLPHSTFEPSSDPMGRVGPSVRLSHLAVVEVRGSDAGSFLQGQLTQDALSMSPTEARAGGYCSAKGRLLANFVMLHPEEQTWWLIMHSGLVESVAKRLKMFVLRAKCTVSARGDLAVLGVVADGLPVWKVERVQRLDCPSDDLTGSNHTPADDAGAEWHIGWWAGRRLVVHPAAASPQEGGAAALGDWQTGDLAAGWPWIEPATVEQFVPQMVNFELLGGVNFRKGCYPGQEVVARSQYRGTLKRRMALFALEDDVDAAPSAATELFHSEDPSQPAGLVVNAVCRVGASPQCLLLAEVKLAAQVTGTLHLGSPEGPVLHPRTLPYRIPTESEM